MEEDAYRSLLARVSSSIGKRVCSSKDLEPDQLAAVLDEFKRLGGLQPPSKIKGKPRNFDSDGIPRMITKVEALLADMRLPWSYADAIAKRQFGIDRVAWCRTQDLLRSIIAALDVELEKRALLGHIERTCERVGISLDQLEVRYGLGGIKGWRRNRKLLKTTGERLTRDYPEPEAGEA